jgi:hypothetical protein
VAQSYPRIYNPAMVALTLSTLGFDTSIWLPEGQSKQVTAFKLSTSAGVVWLTGMGALYFLRS